MKRPWAKHTNEDLALNLEVWMMMDGRLTTEDQKDFFEEVIWRLLVSNFNAVKEETNE